MRYGGWSTDKILKEVYQHVLSDKDREGQDKVTDYFSYLTDDESK